MTDALYPSQIPTRAIERSARDASVPSGSADFAFADVLSDLNPLQHIPVVSSLYRDATGQGISTIARLAGGAALGGPLGFAMAAANAALEGLTGNDLGGHIFAMFDDAPPASYAASVYAKTASNLS